MLAVADEHYEYQVHPTPGLFQHFKIASIASYLSITRITSIASYFTIIRIANIPNYAFITKIANIASRVASVTIIAYIGNMTSTVSISGAKITGKLFPHIVFHRVLYLYESILTSGGWLSRHDR